MWGSTWEDLAKKAQEAASDATTGLTASVAGNKTTASIFNLDSMLGGVDNDDGGDSATIEAVEDVKVEMGVGDDVANEKEKKKKDEEEEEKEKEEEKVKEDGGDEKVQTEKDTKDDTIILNSTISNDLEFSIIKENEIREGYNVKEEEDYSTNFLKDEDETFNNDNNDEVDEGENNGSDSEWDFDEHENCEDGDKIQGVVSVIEDTDNRNNTNFIDCNKNIDVAETEFVDCSPNNNNNNNNNNNDDCQVIQLSSIPPLSNASLETPQPSKVPSPSSSPTSQPPSTLSSLENEPSIVQHEVVKIVMEDGEIDERTTASNANSIDRSTQSINTKPSIEQHMFPELVLEGGEIDERTTTSDADSIDRSTQSINTKPSIVQQEFPELVLEGGEVIERTTTSDADSNDRTTQSMNTKPSIVQQESPELVLEDEEIIERTTTSNVDSIESTTQSKVKIKNQFVKVVENGDTNNILSNNINHDDDDKVLVGDENIIKLSSSGVSWDEVDDDDNDDDDDVENAIDDNDISAMYDDDDLSYDDTGDENEINGKDKGEVYVDNEESNKEGEEGIIKLLESKKLLMSSDNTDTPEKGEVVKVSESSDAANNIKGDDNEIRVNSVDNHIVDKNLHPSSCDEEKDSGVAEKRNDEKHDVSEQSSLPPQQTVPASAIEKFVAQLERIQGEHDIELGDLVKRHMIEIGKVQSELAETKKANLAIAATAAAAAANIPSNKDSHRVASHDKCLAKQRQLERVFNIQLDEKEEERVEALRKVEEMTLKVNVAMKDVDKMKTQVLKR